MNTAGWQLANAARACAEVFEGRSADDALEPWATHPHGAAVRAIALGTLRWHFRLRALLKPLLARGQKLSAPIAALLEVGAHQLEYSQHRPELSVDAAVEAARILQQPRAAGLVNAVLRRFLRERDARVQALRCDPASQSAHPHWLYERLIAAWPTQSAALLAANNELAPMVLRVARDRIGRDAYLAELAAASIDAQPIAWLPDAVRLVRPVAVTALPRFASGDVSVQDAGAQLAARLLDARAGERVLDACAAPGGKSGAILEQAGGALQLTAVDSQPQRVQRLQETFARLGREASVVCADLCEPPEWWDGQPFDRILVDAPCSASGVIRRHPDIRLLRRASDLPALTALQYTVLARCFAMLAPGGRLIYATCSVLPEENDGVVTRFLAEHGGARRAVLELPDVPCVRIRHGVQLLPGPEADTDGFYYASLFRG